MIGNLICLGLTCGGFLGLRYRITALILALPAAFVFPCLLAVLGHADWLTALAWEFLTLVGLQLGFVAGGFASGGTGRRLLGMAPAFRRPHR